MARAPIRQQLAATVGLAGVAAAVHTAPALLAVPTGRAGQPAPFAGWGDPRRVALTFDDGPNPASTPHFLDALDRHGVRATFFLLGCMAVRAPQLCRSIVAAGHEIAIHGWTHRNLLRHGPLRTYAELARTRTLLTQLTGQTPTHFRPPYGVFSAGALLAAWSLGLTPVRWTCWGRDWTPSATEHSVLETVRRGLTGGATVLLHDSDDRRAGEPWRATLAALPYLLDECAHRGLRVGPLREHRLPIEP